MLSGSLQRCPTAHGRAYNVPCTPACYKLKQDFSRKLRARDARVKHGSNFTPFMETQKRSGIKKSRVSRKKTASNLDGIKYSA